MVRHIRSTEHDVLYLNSLFSPWYSILPLFLRRVRLLPKHPVIIACRGQLSPSAIEIHGGRKRSMLRLGRSFGIFRSVIGMPPPSRKPIKSGSTSATPSMCGSRR